MKSLKDRQADRAARKEENDALKGVDNTGNDRVGNVLAIVKDGINAVEDLNPEERAELEERIRNGKPSEGFDPAKAEAGTGWNDPWAAPAAPAAPADETVDADGKALTKAALSKLLDDRSVSYESDANLERLQALVRENPAPAA